MKRKTTILAPHFCIKIKVVQNEQAKAPLSVFSRESMVWLQIGFNIFDVFIANYWR